MQTQLHQLTQLPKEYNRGNIKGKEISPRTRKKHHRKPAVSTPIYAGTNEDIDIGYDWCDQYNMTVSEISHHVGRAYNKEADVNISIVALVALSLDVP